MVINMANESFFEDFLRKAKNYNEFDGTLEVFEETHDSDGKYIGGKGNKASPSQNAQGPSSEYTDGMFMQSVQPVASEAKKPPEAPAAQTEGRSGGAQELPTVDSPIAKPVNQKFAIYNPRTLADVERLISFLRRMEPALVDFDPISDKPEAQRFMDFISGAAYALGASVITARRNQFLIMPTTMDVLKPEDK